MVNSWHEFESALADVDWDHDDYETVTGPQVEEILRHAHRDPQIYQERVRQILEDEALYGSLEQYIDYPRTLMDKFTIYVAPEDRFRVRLHRFWPTSIAGNAIEKVHYHKWHMSTIMLSGSYSENLFRVAELDEATKHARVELESTRVALAGETSSLPARAPHQVHNPAQDTPAVTLFVRGPALQAHARIFDADRSTYYDTFSPRPQIRHALARLSEGDGRFHPMLE